ncbi:hypothetical protein, partial [Candidatus Entotheonella palauensis]|uniref:hypothetical protein n=1 Tax=Candidatus Entotheonella palauensis TaxID=93172 RepID=UPI001177F0F4
MPIPEPGRKPGPDCAHHRGKASGQPLCRGAGASCDAPEGSAVPPLAMLAAAARLPASRAAA